jgi:hypothetical protein
VRLIPVAGVLCWVAALFYCIYIKNYQAPDLPAFVGPTLP